MKRYLITATLLLLFSSVALANVYTRAWCKNPEHGRSPSGGYGWISHVFEGSSSDACWKFASAHRRDNHETGCSYVRADGEYN